MKNIVKNKIILLIFIFGIFACNPNDVYFEGDNPNLTFSVDTVMFDTVFTGIGSATKIFTVRNPNNLPVKLSEIKLAKSINSNFRFNINGIDGSNANDIVIPADDSLFVFVEVTVDPDRDQMLETDSIIFISGNYEKDIDLVAFGQDVILIDDSILNTQTWTAEKPYLVLNRAIVDQYQTLTLEAGTHIHFHRGASLIVLGTLLSNGTLEQNNVFEGDRLEHDYFDVPGQWEGIWLTKLSKDNVINYSHIKNANVGIAVDSTNGANPTLTLSNSIIEHHSFYGISAVMSNVFATNSIIGDCGNYSVLITRGGKYSFYHCTVANYWNYGVRSTPAVFINNYFLYNSVLYIYDLEEANFGNCIIWGSQATEFNFDSYTEGVSFNFKLDNCLVKIDTSAQINTSDINRFTDNILNSDPEFYNFAAYDYKLTENSPAVNSGKTTITEAYIAILTLDIFGISRLFDTAPDIGATEFIPD